MYEEYDVRIGEFKNIHRGDRCFVLGSGPSLNKQNLKPLEKEIVIGCNASFYLNKDYNLKFKYYVVSEFGASFKPKSRHIPMLSLDTILFIGGPAASAYSKNIDYYKQYKKAEVILIKDGEKPTKDTEKWKDRDIVNGTPLYRHIPAAMALPISYYMGFDKVYLLGIDMDYTMNQNYFYGSRIPSGEMHNKSYYDRSIKEFGFIASAFEEDGRKLYNATKGGNLNNVERINFEELF
jgi:hypothetical protein